MGSWCQNDVASMRRNHVTSTLIRRHFYVICQLGYVQWIPLHVSIQHFIITFFFLGGGGGCGGRGGGAGCGKEETSGIVFILIVEIAVHVMPML